MEYLDFDIRVTAGRDGKYLLRAESESYGEEEADISLSPDAPEIVEINARLATRQTDRSFLEATGTDLYNRLFVANIDVLFQRSLGEVKNDANKGLRIRLRIGAPELAVLPWELLYSDFDEEFVGTRVKSPLVRYLDMSGYRRALATPYPLRILVAIPHGSDPSRKLDAASEKAVIDQALEELGNKVEVTYLNEQYPDRRVTLRRIRERLSEQDYHCFHFVGHGTFRNDQGYLVLDGEDGRDDVVADERFAELFANAPTIKVVILNACKGAALSSSQPLAGSAARLVKHGVPAVVAMQFSIYDAAAVDFARSFYHSLFRSSNRGRVDVAVSIGRQQLAVNYGDQREIAAPVLFMHTANGMLFVPETGNFLADLPRNKEQIDTLQAAHEATASEVEAARFKRRIAIARRSVQIGLAVGTLIFFLSMIRVLDIFTIDTRAEFLVMAMGNGLAEHNVSNDLRIVTIAGGGLDIAEKRARVGQIIADLAAAKPRVIALDMFFQSENGAFKSDPESGRRLVEVIDRAEVPVVVGAEGLEDGELEAPNNLRTAAVGLGHLCFESKMGLARSLPIVANASGGQYPSLALTAYAAFHRGQVLTGEKAEVAEPVILFPDRPSVKFAVSEVNDANRKTEACPLIRDGDQVAHRFIRFSPDQQLARITMSAAELRQSLASDPAAVRNQLENKLVLVGVLGVGDIVHDLAGDRDGVFWHADAINNLLLDETIIPLRDSAQLLMMLLLAGVAAALRLEFRSRKRIGILVLIVLSASVPVFAVWTYGRHGYLINPAYHLLALWLAWWAAGRFGKTWVL